MALRPCRTAGARMEGGCRGYSEGVTPSKDKRRKLYSEATQLIETDNERKKGSYAGVVGDVRIVRHRKARKRANKILRCAQGQLVVVWHLAVVGLSHHTKVGRRRAFGVDIGRKSVRSYMYSVLDKDKVWVCAAVGLPYPCCLCSVRVPDCFMIAYLLNSVCGCLVV